MKNYIRFPEIFKKINTFANFSKKKKMLLKGKKLEMWQFGEKDEKSTNQHRVLNVIVGLASQISCTKHHA